MKIGIPSMGDRGLKENVGEHFGRVPAYTIIDTENDEVSTLQNTSEHLGGSGYPAEILAGAGIDAMICMGIGRRAISMFSEKGIAVYTGASGTVEETLERFNKGELSECGEDGACTQHAFREQGGGMGHHHHHH
jgi:predicted Fe-Mo cluster-binding NifX family protein